MDITFNATTATNNNIVSLSSFDNEPSFIDWDIEKITHYSNEVIECAKKVFNYNFKNCKFKFNRRLKRAYAQCYYMDNYIELSYFLLNDYDDDFVKSTLIHEIVHALSYQFDGLKSKINHKHDKTFKRMCGILCSKMGVPDGSSACENGKLRIEVIKEYKEKNKVTIVEKIIDIPLKNSIKYSFICVVSTLFLIIVVAVVVIDSS